MKFLFKLVEIELIFMVFNCLQVKYVAEGFLEKNKDTLPDTLVDAVKNSSMRLLRTLFRRSSSGSMLRRSTLRKRYITMHY